MPENPFSFDLPAPQFIPSHFDQHITRRLSALRGQFVDQEAYASSLAKQDTLVYEVYEIRRPEISGEIATGISIVHPGLVGCEFFMTKGHYHRILATAEMYYCLKGEGCMVMETPEGEAVVEALSPGRVLYIPPRWAHRSVCTGRQADLVTFFAYPADAGHDYGTIEAHGFRKLVLQGPGGVEIAENPRWSGPGPAAASAAGRE
jgi:glucose-6-phosphate isomerase